MLSTPSTRKASTPSATATVLLVAVLFLVGIGSRFPVRVARYGLNGVAGVLLVVCVIQLLGLPGPPS